MTKVFLSFFIAVTVIIFIAFFVLIKTIPLNSFSLITLYAVFSSVAVIYLFTSILLWNFITKTEKKKNREESITVKTLQDAPLGKYTFIEYIRLQNYPNVYVFYLKRNFRSVIIILGESEFSEIQSLLRKECEIEHIRVHEVVLHENGKLEIHDSSKLIFTQKNDVEKTHDSEK